MSKSSQTGFIKVINERFRARYHNVDVIDEEKRLTCRGPRRMVDMKRCVRFLSEPKELNFSENLFYIGSKKSKTPICDDNSEYVESANTCGQSDNCEEIVETTEQSIQVFKDYKAIETLPYVVTYPHGFQSDSETRMYKFEELLDHAFKYNLFK